MGEYLLKIFLAAIAYFTPISPLIHLVLIFIAVDFLTGIYVSYRTKQKIVSHRLRKTIEKFVFYSIAIILGYMFQVEFASWSNLSQIIAGFIASIELLSIYENVKIVTGLNLVTKFKQYINKILTKNEKI